MTQCLIQRRVVLLSLKRLPTASSKLPDGLRSSPNSRWANRDLRTSAVRAVEWRYVWCTGGRTMYLRATEERSGRVVGRPTGITMIESMRLAHQAGAAVGLVALTLWLQCAGMGVLICWTRNFIERLRKRLSPWHSAVLMVRFAAAMLVLQILEALVWACFYRWKCFSAWETSFYFSAASYSTVGYGDVLLPQMWRSWADRGPYWIADVWSVRERTVRHLDSNFGS